MAITVYIWDNHELTGHAKKRPYIPRGTLDQKRTHMGNGLRQY